MGKENSKVNISALGDKWGGIHVIGNNKNSEINHAIFSKLDYFQNDKFTLTGAINFYNSNIKINNSIFKESNYRNKNIIQHPSYSVICDNI